MHGLLIFKEQLLLVFMWISLRDLLKFALKISMLLTFLLLWGQLKGFLSIM
jgi:hypothetical protein